MISRPLDPGEAFFYLSDHVSCMNFVVFAQRNAPLQPERIAQALAVLQHENALLQVRIDWTEESGLRFAPAPGQAIELQCHDTTQGQWQQWIEHELSHLFAARSAPLMRCLYLQQTDSSDCVLALTFHHSIADGRSGTALLRRLLGLLSSNLPAVPKQQAAALPAMADLFPQRYRWADQPDAVKQLRSTLIGDYRRYGALSAIPWLASEARTREPKLIQRTLPEELTQRLLQRARTESTTLHGLLCAAQLLAQHRLSSPGDQSTFFLSCPIDMRAHVEPAQPTTPTGLFVSLISNTFQLTDDTQVWALARDVIAQTRLQIARGEGHLLFWLYGMNGSPVLPSHLEAFSKKALASLPNTMVSNIGAIENVPQDPTVEAISFALCPMPYQTLFTAASSYRGQLILNFGYDAQRLSNAKADKLTDHIQDTLSAAGA